MKTKNLLILASAVVVLGVIAMLMQRNAPVNQTNRELPDEALVLPGLDIGPDSPIARLEIAQGDSMLAIALQEDEWVVTNSYDYPADVEKLGEAIRTLAGLKIGQLVPASEEKREGMQLGKDGGIQVTLADKAGKSVASLLLGKTREAKTETPLPYGSMPDGRYLLSEAEDDVILVEDSLSSFTPRATDWIDTSLASVPATDILSIRITKPGGERLVFDRSSGSLELEGLSEEEELDTSATYGIDSALSYLRMEGVADPALSAEQTGLTTGTLFRAETKQHVIYRATVGAQAPGSEYYLSLNAEALSPPPSETNATILAEFADAGEQAKDFNARHQGWTYLVSSYNAGNMSKRREDLVKERETAEGSENAEEAGTAADLITPMIQVPESEPGTETTEE